MKTLSLVLIRIFLIPVLIIAALLTGLLLIFAFLIDISSPKREDGECMTMNKVISPVYCLSEWWFTGEVTGW